MRAQKAGGLPPSDVSAGVGLAGLLGLFAWILFCRTFPLTADWLGLDGSRGVLSGPHAALAAMLFTTVPMVVWSLLVDKTHLRASTGIDWSRKRALSDVVDISIVKLAGLWATWAIIAGLYCLCRWYWNGQYLFSMEVLRTAAIPLFVLSVPYVLWLDRYMIEPRDHAWHFGAMLIGREAWDGEEVKKHWRAWIIKSFFGAFMISILPPGFAQVVEADIPTVVSDPVQFGLLLTTLLFVVDVQIGTVGYLVTLRPLDAHIRSGNPFLGGWLAALICYPPFVWGIIGNGDVLSYEHNVAGWDVWLQGNTALLWVWALWLVFLTAIYAWATVAFGIRFSNLTYRGVLTNGPYRYTRHPAYLSKNLFWWCAVMPFLVTNGSVTDAIRNTFFLLCVNAIYFWRAKTEEAHLLAEDAKYREYHVWMEQNGLITAPLARLFKRVRSRHVDGAIEPAE
ncbi:isoprenylcysteine carboxylmethyltransferase family protein [Altererythrobacter arenosus]|uniref:Isoprenylcysteine carboxylmethyltransferase family protein n=1 Tax=Altererythrobacter arenosus TaxID=3032592 RepID=A0ABY8FWG4_9SPHN|nr:isoprenylcysteine carboxylmethyltransferase family protein [Altererythrobacter sp. CAU 1644]WFL77556.1 isoprenylcysteine carboxylmethyltransferase family protein [Altererythrobacter sp. CAU 1644]